MTKFIMIFTGRCGGSFLMNTLNLQKNVYSELELLVKMTPMSALNELRFCNYDYDHMKIAFEKNLSGVFDAGKKQIDAANQFLAGTYEKTIVGFSTKYQDVIFPDELLKLLNLIDIKVIYNYRENIIKQLISNYNFDRHIEEVRRIPLRIVPKKFHMELKKLEFISECCNQFVGMIKHPRFDVPYSGLLKNSERIFSELCNFLGTSYNDHLFPSKKKTNDDLRLAVENYDELYEYFAGTKYQQYLE